MKLRQKIAKCPIGKMSDRTPRKMRRKIQRWQAKKGILLVEFGKEVDGGMMVKVHVSEVVQAVLKKHGLETTAPGAVPKEKQAEVMRDIETELRRRWKAQVN